MLYFTNDRRPESIPSAPPLAQQVAIGVGALGRIEPRSRVVHVSHEAGLTGARIAQVLVHEGQTVKAGERIATFSDYERRETEVQLCQSEIETSNARISATEAELEDAARDFNRKVTLSKTAVVSVSVRDGAELRLNKAKAEVQVARAAVKLAGVNCRLKEQQLQQATVTAPIDGTVVYVYARPGERPSESSGIVDMADLTAMDVVAEVYESDIFRLKTGLHATVKIPGADLTYSAQVREIGYLVRKNKINDTDPLADRDARIIEVRLSLEEKALIDLSHQIYRQVQVQVLP